LKQEINRLGLENQVLLTGQLSNPYPAIRHADCFILPSKHEGQPVTLLEAMALGMPVITTTLPGCIEVVGLGYGKLTETDQSSVANAMREFLGDRTAASGVFDA
ncbi:glycosyltransferase, partial [Escherichia coli]|nr:glycosyltransferase [Escherichia coli]